MILNNLKVFLGIKDDSKDEVLKLIIDTTTSRLKVIIGGIEPPLSLDHIILEVSIVRFNRIGSEGLKSHTVEGENQSFNEDDDFKPFEKEIQAFLDSQSGNTKGKLRFL